MAKKLKINLDEFQRAKTKLEDSLSELTSIQEELKKTIEDLVQEKGWKSDGSAEFVNQYNSSWVEGIDDRKAVMERMCEHLENAIQEYEPIVTEAEQLKLQEGSGRF